MSDIFCEYTHDELAHSLAQHLDREENMVWEDIPAGMAGSVRPDVFVMQKSFSKPNPITYEVKVSVPDFRSDVTSGKWQSYLDFSYGVVFAAPKGLITKKDIPNGCGLIQYNGSGIWRTIKKPTLSPCVIDSEFLLKLLMGGADRMTQKKPIKNRDFDKWKHHDTLKKKFGDDIQEKMALVKNYPEMVQDLKIKKGELIEVLGLRDTDYHNGFIHQAEYAISKLKEIASEKHRKKKICERLEKLRSDLNNDIDQIKKEYT